MGIGPFKPSSCGCSYPRHPDLGDPDSAYIHKLRIEEMQREVIKKAEDANPSPRLYEINHISVYGRYTIALIKYPNCTNYEGVKILLYKDVSEDQLKSAGYLDPHFCESVEHLKPMARFVPTIEGMSMAIELAQALDAS
jgi:hypothetical protein